MAVTLQKLASGSRRRIESAARTMTSPELGLAAKLRFIRHGFGEHSGPGSYTLRFPDGELFLSNANNETDRNVVWDVYINRCYPGDFRGSTVVDIGAHKGYFGAYALMHGAEKVISYEPEDENFRFLGKTAGSFAHRGSQWELRHAAVSATNGQMELRVDSASWAHALAPFAPGTDGSPGSVQLVESAAMTDVLTALASSPRSGRLIVKIDAEGAECEIVMKTPADAWRLVDEVYVEVHDFARCSAAEIAAHLAGAGLEAVGEEFGVLHMHRPPAVLNT